MPLPHRGQLAELRVGRHRWKWQRIAAMLDGRAKPEVIGDAEEGRRGAIPDGRADIDLMPDRERP